MDNEVVKPTADSVMNSWQHTCDICGKVFFVTLPSLYVYKENVVNKPKWYCSYTCSREAERPQPKTKRGETCCSNMIKFKERAKYPQRGVK